MFELRPPPMHFLIHAHAALCPCAGIPLWHAMHWIAQQIISRKGVSKKALQFDLPYKTVVINSQLQVCHFGEQHQNHPPLHRRQRRRRSVRCIEFRVRWRNEIALCSCTVNQSHIHEPSRRDSPRSPTAEPPPRIGAF